MSTGLIVAIVAAVLLLVAFMLIAKRGARQRELKQHRERAAQVHRESAEERATRAELAEETAKRSKLEAERMEEQLRRRREEATLAERQAEQEREHAQMHQERAELHERGKADDELEIGESRDEHADRSLGSERDVVIGESHDEQRHGRFTREEEDEPAPWTRPARPPQ